MATWFPGLVEFFKDLGIYSSIFIFLVIWSIFWRGAAMWKAARKKQYFWFAAIYLFESLGILPMIYLWMYKKKR
ncbi:MAG: DUF5652 family protein [Candidatus Nanoarchaeia archaeon]|nr:DUF5652 family protein [Candidatus Nanoarchaeia archaeon]